VGGRKTFQGSSGSFNLGGRGLKRTADKKKKENALPKYVQKPSTSFHAGFEKKKAKGPGDEGGKRAKTYQSAYQ